MKNNDILDEGMTSGETTNSKTFTCEDYQKGFWVMATFIIVISFEKAVSGFVSVGVPIPEIVIGVVKILSLVLSAPLGLWSLIIITNAPFPISFGKEEKPL